MTGVEINQYHIDRVQIKAKEAFQDTAQKAKHQQDFINNLQECMTVVEDRTAGMAEATALKTTVEAWEERIDSLEKNAHDLSHECGEIGHSGNMLGYSVANMKLAADDQYHAHKAQFEALEKLVKAQSQTIAAMAWEAELERRELSSALNETRGEVAA